MSEVSILLERWQKLHLLKRKLLKLESLKILKTTVKDLLLKQSENEKMKN